MPWHMMGAYNDAVLTYCVVEPASSQSLSQLLVYKKKEPQYYHLKTKARKSENSREGANSACFLCKRPAHSTVANSKLHR